MLWQRRNAAAAHARGRRRTLLFAHVVRTALSDGKLFNGRLCRWNPNADVTQRHNCELDNSLPLPADGGIGIGVRLIIIIHHSRRAICGGRHNCAATVRISSSEFLRLPTPGRLQLQMFLYVCCRWLCCQYPSNATRVSDRRNKSQMLSTSRAREHLTRENGAEKAVELSKEMNYIWAFLLAERVKTTYARYNAPCAMHASNALPRMMIIQERGSPCLPKISFFLPLFFQKRQLRKSPRLRTLRPWLRTSSSFWPRVNSDTVQRSSKSDKSSHQLIAPSL